VVWLVRAWRDRSRSGSAAPLVATVAAVALTGAAYLPSPGVTPEVLSAETQKNRRILNLMSQDRAAAEQSLARLVDDPNDFQAQLEAGQLLNKLGKFYEAIDHLSAAVRLNGRHLQARCVLSSALLHAGRAGEAVDQLQSASQIRSGSREVGAVSRAIVEEQADALTPEQASTVAALLDASSDAAAQAGKRDEALSFLHSALEAATVSKDSNLVERLQRKKDDSETGQGDK
jgi:tetratricopeptide (TPR) repeat protein